MVEIYQNAIRSLWDGLCDVFVLETVRNKANGRDEPTERLWANNKRCRLSFSNIAVTGENNSAAQIAQTVKLFISKDVEIPPGAKIVVKQNGITRAFVKSGEPAFYSTHQEVMLVPFERWA